jgi:NAD(P)-dependent dehydrogenase (short-subunit alcohol dehydrogenase family)
MGTLLPTQEFSMDMIDGGDNTIINISSMNAFAPLTKIPAYSAAKASISNFTQWLAVYFADTGIRVNAIAPGFLYTKQTAALFYEEDGITPTSRLHKIIEGTPMKKLGKPEDLAGILLWLLSNEAAGFVTGVVIPVDGGFSSYGGV